MTSNGVFPRAQARIAHWEGVGKLVTLLSHGNPAAKMSAMGALRHAPSPPFLHMVFCICKALFAGSIFVRCRGGLLRAHAPEYSSNPSIEMSAPVILTNRKCEVGTGLVQSRQASQQRAHTSCNQPVLRLFTRHSSAPCRLCRYLAENRENRRLIQEAGGIPPLVKTFVAAWGAAPELQEIACKCLLNLSISPGAGPPHSWPQLP